MSGFLGVKSSLTNRRWRGPESEADRRSQAIIQATGLSDALCRVLARLGVSGEEAETYLDPKLRDLRPDPSSLKDMDRAAQRVVTAVGGHEKIAIFADYDVDGGASAALMHDWLAQVGISATVYVPDRITEGYGPNAPAMKKLAAAHDLIICVDCGTLAFEAIEAAQGAEVVVLDHHLGAETLPAALAIVNPNRQDETGALSFLCAAGVVFLLLVAANRLLRNSGQTSPDLMPMLDLVALATVADVAPLVGLNRALVRQGLKIMSARRRPGLTAFCDVAKLDSAPKPYHLGFLLGPRVNAGGRIGKADLGTRLLACKDPHEAAALAEKLDQLNAERRAIEEQVRLKAIEQAQDRGFDAPLVWAAGEDWHPGVVGIVASRLKEMANRPAVVLSINGDEAMGSARSISGVDLGAAIAMLSTENLITKGGGHKMAAGLSLRTSGIEAAMARLSELLAQQGAGTAGPPDLMLDGLLDARAVSVEMIEDIERAGPFGAGAPAPRFALASQRIAFAKRAGKNHLRLTLEGDGGARLEAISFGAFDSPLGTALETHGGGVFHVAGRLEINSWGGRKKPKLRLEDACIAAP